ncbi:MAG: hypothetical protein QM753_06050 [Thermomicrobiales bacterium]
MSLPARIERALDLKPGERLSVRLEDDTIALSRPRFTLGNVFGSVENVFGSVEARPDDDVVSIDDRIRLTQDAHFEERAQRGDER